MSASAASGAQVISGWQIGNVVDVDSFTLRSLRRLRLRVEIFP
jgi:hypothetical protein